MSLQSLSPAIQLRNNYNPSDHFIDENLLREQYEQIITEGNKDPQNLTNYLKKLRTLILMKGIPPETKEEGLNVEHKCSLRGRIWQILLRVPQYDANEYLELVKKGPSDIHEKFLKDGYRSFLNRKNETELLRRVTQPKLARVINSLRHIMSNSKMDITYCQGMNSVCSPFLYVMPEVDAFFSFVQFIKTVCPLYWNTDITGAYHGQKVNLIGVNNFFTKLFREILQIVDVELYEYFEKKEFKLEAINLRCILSFNGTTPPIVECLKLWDFFLAFGFHLNILCVVGQVVLMREEIMKSPR
jgi:cell cycle arrest protein BUB2